MPTIRVLVLSTLALLPAMANAQARARLPRDTQTVVFVCEHGTVKSVVAATYFNRLASERHLAMRGVSRGTSLDAAVPSLVVEGLRRDGLSLGSFAPTALDQAELARALAVVTFDRPAVVSSLAGTVPSLAWDGLPAVSANYDIARDSIRARVTRLVDSLAGVARGAPRRR